jgi:hypothetical protein
MDFDDLNDPRRPYAEEIEMLKSMNAFQDTQITRDQMSFRIREVFLDFFLLRGDKDAPERERITLFLDHIDALSNCVPTADELEKAPLLNEWCAIRDTDTVLLIGYVTGHPHLMDQGRARTSLVFQVQPEKGWARTWNRFYRLGAPSHLTLSEWQSERKISPSMWVVDFAGDT